MTSQPAASIREGRPLRIALLLPGEVLAPPSLLNGFTGRYRNVLGALVGTGADVSAIALGSTSAGLDLDDSEFRLSMTIQVEIPGEEAASQAPSRVTRILGSLSLLAGRQRNDQLDSVRSALAEVTPDLVIATTFPDWMGGLLASSGYKSILFAEEDGWKDPELRRSSAGTALRRFEEFAVCASSPPPVSVVVIGDHEVGWARRLFPRSRVDVLPHSLDWQTWEAGRGRKRPSWSRDVAVIGHMGHLRNAAGLAAIASELSQRSRGLRLAVASATSLNPNVDPIPPDVIKSFGPVEDLIGLYSRCAAALVPSFAVTGVKTTIMQAWSQACPVVTTDAAARTVGGTHRKDLLAGSSAAEVADLLIELVCSPDLQNQLSSAGFDRFREAFSQETHNVTLAAIIDRALSNETAQGGLLRYLASRVRVSVGRGASDR